MSNLDSSDARAASGPETDPGLTVGISTGSETSKSIGRYHLIRCIGEGGMGEVWLAEQIEPVRRRVALKLIRAGMDNRDGINRFQTEVQALALMDHPAIAHVYDAGATADQRPYFAMEYVPGIPITEYCDTQRLAVRERLQLFALVCEGVQHAHQKAVIHRDLKPSNILVAEVDGRPTPKIIDFGIAKALATRLTSETLYTVAGFLIGTPDYMSPEQALGDEDIDTRADIYSLGIVLYELLTGTLPFRGTSTKLAPDEFIRRLREDDVPRPSTKVRQSRVELTVSAGRRRSDPQTLARELRGDLDAIVLKALEKDRRRRYSSASELAIDIGLYLQHLPVAASSPTTAYRVRKFVVRHRGVVGAAALVLLLLISFAAAMTVETVRIARERDRADREAEAAKQTSDFLVDLFRSANPAFSTGHAITARDLLDAGAHQAATALAGAPVAEARLQNAVGEAYRMMGEDALATEQFNRALELADGSEGKNSDDSLTALEGLFLVQRSAGHGKESKDIARDMQSRASPLPAGSDGWARAQRCAAETLVDTGQFQLAELMMRQCLAAVRAQHGDGRAEASTLLSLSRTLRAQSRFEEAADLSRKLIVLQERLVGPDAPPALEAKVRVADNLESLGKTDEALAILVKVRAAQERIFGPDHFQTLWTEYEIGVAQTDGGHAEEGVTTLRDAARRSLAARGPDAPFSRLVLVDLGSALYQAGKAGEAEPILRRCVELNKVKEGPEGTDTLVAEHELGTALEKLGRFDEAQALIDRVYEVRLRSLGPEHAHTVDAIATLGNLAADQKQWSTAESRYRQAIALMIKTHMSHSGIQEYRYRLAAVLMNEGKTPEALDFLQQSVENGFPHGDWLDANTAFDPVRKTERYRAIRAKIQKHG